jgi:hypothetical protein
MNIRRKMSGSGATNFLWALAVFAVAIVAIGGSFWVNKPHRAAQTNESADITVYKTKYCGCCHKWVEHLRDSGLTVAVNDVDSTHPFRSKFGIPDTMASCHTAVAGDYWVEGHVPADLIQQLLQERPENIQGIAAPGMPQGSPGMEGTNPVTYDVVAYTRDATTSVYATRQGTTAPDPQ